MKKKLLLLLLLLLLPTFVNASYYTNKEEGLLKNREYMNEFVDHTKYLVKDTYGPRTDFISIDEFKISGGINSYLINNISDEYWTNTEYDTNNTYIVSNSVPEKYINNTSETFIKGSVFAKNNVILSGQGTYVNPWMFQGIVTYTLNIDLGSVGGSFTDTSFKTTHVLEEGDILDIPVPVSENYTFVKWNISSGDININGNSVTVKNSNATISAEWKINSHTLTLNLDGGRFTSASTKTSYLLNVNESIDISAIPVKTNYTFIGWSTPTNGSTYTGTTFKMGNANSTMTAQWKLNTYTLTLNLNGGRFTSASTKTSYLLGVNESINISAIPVRDNYTFIGWSAPTNGSTYTGTTFKMGNANSTMTAQWKLTTYTLTLNLDGGSFTSTSVKTSYMLKQNETVTISAIPVKTNYVFAGWTTPTNGSTYSGTTFKMGSSNSSMTAKWVKVDNKVFAYTGNYVLYTIPITGKYKIELWGGSGGGSGYYSGSGGAAGYVSGIATFNTNDKLYFYVGGAGSYNSSWANTAAGGWNGGGIGGTAHSGHNSNGSGGGASDVRLNSTSSSSRIIVAGGGGGTSMHVSGSNNKGAAAGGLVGYTGTCEWYPYYCHGGGAGVQWYEHGDSSHSGIGGNGTGGQIGNGGGGGGYYGGASCYLNSENTSYAVSFCGGGGGSSYINTSRFSSRVMIDGMGYSWTTSKGGLMQMPKPAGGNYSSKVGHMGNGYAKITYQGQ